MLRNCPLFTRACVHVTPVQYNGTEATLSREDACVYCHLYIESQLEDNIYGRMLTVIVCVCIVPDIVTSPYSSDMTY